ncbi:MAG: (2Fe-2S)-binding protein [Planctomycetes bacterium]|nr:(2Fe-2S)-binding protein [Planctomycetota bacterium]
MSWDFRKPGTRICVCYNATNDQALTAWRSSKAPSVDQLTKEFECGRNCAMCLPYFATLLNEYQKGTWPANPAQADTNWFGAKHG